MAGRVGRPPALRHPGFQGRPGPDRNVPQRLSDLLVYYPMRKRARRTAGGGMDMKRKTAKKFQLSRETLRNLERAHLEKVAGGLESTPIGTCTDNEPCQSTTPRRLG